MCKRAVRGAPASGSAAGKTRPAWPAPCWPLPAHAAAHPTGTSVVGQVQHGGRRTCIAAEPKIPLIHPRPARTSRLHCCVRICRQAAVVRMRHSCDSCARRLSRRGTIYRGVFVLYAVLFYAQTLSRRPRSRSSVQHRSGQPWWPQRALYTLSKCSNKVSKRISSTEYPG